MSFRPNADQTIDSLLYWYCVAICAYPEYFGLKDAERGELDRLIDRYRAGSWMRKDQQWAVIRIVTGCRRRRRELKSKLGDILLT